MFIGKLFEKIGPIYSEQNVPEITEWPNKSQILFGTKSVLIHHSNGMTGLIQSVCNYKLYIQITQTRNISLSKF